VSVQVDGVNNWFTDEFSRVRLFHGVNSVRKEFPWYYEYLLNDTKLDDLARSGFNVVRLGSMWSGVEPAEGVYNDTYIDILRDIIEVRDLFSSISLRRRNAFTVRDIALHFLICVDPMRPKMTIVSSLAKHAVFF
jgi:hypothetical protein